MELNWIGVVTGLGTFFSIWFGHVAVRKIEFAAPNIWAPVLIAWTAGIASETASFALKSNTLSALFGILGVTLLWDGLEFFRQQNRVKKGHAPANPVNPRHARILVGYPASTTMDWLKRSPKGRKLSQEEITLIREALS